jgi:putative acetyltransferase
MKEIKIRKVASKSKDLRNLIEELDSYLSPLYPENSIHKVNLDTAEKDNVIFILAYKDLKAIGCVALRPLNDSECEMKRMYVIEKERGKGYSNILCTEIENIARKKGFRRILIETGYEQPVAIGLYKKHGYKRISRFGEYIDDPLSVCFAKKLTI